MSAFLTLVGRDLKLAVRDGGALGTALGFFLVVVAMMPLGLGPDLKLLSRIAPGILWIALLLSALLSMGRMFEADTEDGTLDAIANGPLPLEAVVAGKALAHWIVTCLPLTLLAPVVGLLLNLEIAAYPVLVGTLLIGTPAVSFLGAIGAALTLGAQRGGGLLVALLVLPFYVPTLIYGIMAIAAIITPPGDAVGSLLILAAISVASVVIGPVAGAAALRYQMQ